MKEGWVDQAFEAARAGELETLRRLLSDQPDGVDARGDRDMVLLHVAAERDDVAMTGLLLDLGADTELEASWGQTPLEWAANVNAAAAARTLLARGAARVHLWTCAALGMRDEVDAWFDGDAPRPGAARPRAEGADLSGWTGDTAFLLGDAVSDAFHIACRNGRAEVARTLRERGADIDARGYFGAPALHWAAAGGHGAIVEWLLAEGANPHVRDPRFGGDAASWAREFGHVELAERIEHWTSEGRSDDGRTGP